MKKRIMTALVILAMVLSLAGCVRKTTICVTVGDIGDYDIVQIPEGFKNLSKQDYTVKMTVDKEGEYPLVIRADDGKEYTIVVGYKDGVASVDAGELNCIAGVE